jgi:RNA polymerase sigma-70 factor, ECF subfamily
VTPSDRELVDALVRARDARAFEALYDRHTPLMYGLALRLVGGHEGEAREVVQDAWIRAAERLSAFAWQATLSTWLCGVVVNCTRELSRAKGRDLGLNLDDLPLAGDDARLAGTVDRVDLERALAKLPDGYRHVLVLHDVEGFTHDEIGELLGMRPGTSKSQLARARTAMRRLMEEGNRDGT